LAGTLEELSDVELRGLAEDLGLDPAAKETRSGLVARIRARQQSASGVSREELARILRWAGEEVTDFDAKDPLVRRFYRLNFRRTAGLSPEDLRIVARMHGMNFDEGTSPEALVRMIETSARGWTDVLKRAGGRVVGLITKKAAANSSPDEAAPPSEEQEGVVSSSLKKGFKAALHFGMDDYVKEKLDEIEARIDRKLDELDRKMDEWRVREVRHRLRIITYTVIATVIVAVISIIYKYLVR
jgi:hypothetical protein